MLIIDESGTIRYANRQVSALFGHQHDDLIGMGIENLMPDRFRTLHSGHRDSYFHHVRLRAMGEGLELLARRMDGAEFPVEISLSPIEAGDHVLVAAAIRDVTDRKRVEAELITAREAAERARETADAARERADKARLIADRANLDKSRFLATASHDLRQPLQTLALLNGTLRRLVGDSNALATVEQQEAAINAMSRLLNALLDISKLESGAIRPEPADFRVASLFDGLRQEFSSVAATKGLDLRVEVADEVVRCDPSLVEQILRNLVSNAIKYTRSGRVLFQCRAEPGSQVRIEVIDTGVGIPSEQLPLIYGEFYQVGVPANSARNGYGLGLSIVQRLVKLLRLGFEVKSEVGRGSTFSILLPAAAHPAAAIQAVGHDPPTRQPQLGKAKVLLVEDDPAVRDATCMLLRLEGYQVTAVASLGDALQSVRDVHDVDLLVTDYHLSNGETGTQVITALRERLGTPLKAVLITGDTSSVVRDLPLDTHLRFASKPLKADDLLVLLRSLLAA